MESRPSEPDHAGAESGQTLFGTFTDTVREALQATTLMRRLVALDAIYDRVERHQRTFRNSAAACG
ncbi:MAG TPA: hypothetical protein VN437_01000, partial [Rectinemataceae bacterium]|nr:hypothetical protein [Rectinemataceae bacterium]